MVEPLFSQFELSGSVRDESGERLPFANVLLLHSTDSSLVKGDVSSMDGQFQFSNIPSGSYLLAVKMVGFQPAYQTIKREAGKLELPPITLREDVATLSEVEVVGRKPLFEQKMGRLVINVQNSVTAAGGTALDILERSPGVAVNRQAGNILMSGKEGVIVMINGKRSRVSIDAVVQMLRGMSAGNIEKIELISNPPARFEAEGNAGVINIVLKENTQEGLNGNFSVFTGYGLAEKYGGNLNFNYRKEKLNLFGDYSFLWDNNPQIFSNFRRLDYEGTLTETDARSDRDPVDRNHRARLGIDYQLSDKTVVGALFAGYDTKWDMLAFNDIYTTENNATTYTRFRNEEINNWQHLMGNLNLQHTFREGEVLSFNADYLYYQDDNPHNYDNQYYDAQGELFLNEKMRISKFTPIDIGVGAIDYSRPLGENASWSTGIKGTLSRFGNDVSVERLLQEEWVADPEFTQDYSLKEDIAAAYTSFDLSLGASHKLTAGLRYEYTDSYLSSGEEAIVDREYGYLFPSFSYSFELDKNNTLQASFSRRITRPTFNDLAPFVIFIDPTTFFSGNSALQPALSDGGQLSYNFKQYYLSFQYSHEQSAIAGFQPSVDPETNRQIFAAANLDSRNTATLLISAPVYISNWWEMQNSLMGSWQEARDQREGEDIYTRQTNLRFTSAQTFKLPHDFTLEFSGFYQSAFLFGLIEFGSAGTLNIGLQKRLNNGGGTLSLSFSDVFWTNGWFFDAHIPELHLNANSDFLLEPRVLRLTYSRDFGNKKLKSARQRQTGSEAERGRVN